MPNLSDYSNKQDWMGACVPKMMDEGSSNDQAVAACMNMWRNKGKPTHLTVKADSLQDVMNAIYRAFSTQFPSDMAAMPMPQAGGYIDDIYPDFVIVCSGDKTYQVSYETDANGVVTFAPIAEWQEVRKQETYEPVKVGARNSKKDAARLQSIHDYAVENGAMCKKSSKDVEVEELIYFGDRIKAIKLDDGSVKFAGYLVRYGNEKRTDLTNEFFAPDTEYGDVVESDVYFNHRLPVEANGKRVTYKDKLGKAKLTRDDVGIFAETIISAHNEYEQAIIDAGLADALGWSSGTAGHLVDREQVGKAWKITRWPLGLDASLTPTPAESRNSVVPLKSLVGTLDITGRPGSDNKNVSDNLDKETHAMELTEIKGLLDEQKSTLLTELQAQVKTAAKEAVDDVLTKLPEVKAKLGGKIEVTEAEEDRPFKNIGEHLVAIADATKGRRVHPRLRGLKAMDFNDPDIKAPQGLNEAVPSQGEFLLEPTLAADLLKPLHDTGVFYRDVAKMPVGANSNSGWINGVDETSRATGSRWGGVRGYHTAEAGTMTSSKPKFRRINWELHKVYVLQYATDELLKDANQLNAIISQSSAEELDFMVNDDVLNGIGGDRPVGVLNSGALISVTRLNANQVNGEDLISMWARMPARNKGGAKWYINDEVQPQLDKLTFTSGSTALLSPYVSYGVDGVMRIMGKEVVPTEFNAALGTAGDILLADMREYLFWEKGGVEAASSIHVQFLTDETVFRFIMRYDGQSSLASAITPYKGSNTKSPFITLTASS